MPKKKQFRFRNIFPCNRSSLLKVFYFHCRQWSNFFVYAISCCNRKISRLSNLQPWCPDFRTRLLRNEGRIKMYPLFMTFLWWEVKEFSMFFFIVSLLVLLPGAYEEEVYRVVFCLPLRLPRPPPSWDPSLIVTLGGPGGVLLRLPIIETLGSGFVPTMSQFGGGGVMVFWYCFYGMCFPAKKNTTTQVHYVLVYLGGTPLQFTAIQPPKDNLWSLISPGTRHSATEAAQSEIRTIVTFRM